MDLERIAKLETQVDVMIKEIDEVKVEVKELHSRITTGNREIVEKMDAMQTRIEHRMDAQAIAAKQQHQEIQEEIRKDVEKIETRVSSLERWKWYVIGAVAAFAYILGNAGFLGNILK